MKRRKRDEMEVEAVLSFLAQACLGKIISYLGPESYQCLASHPVLLLSCGFRQVTKVSEPHFVSVNRNSNVAGSSGQCGEMCTDPETECSRCSGYATKSHGSSSYNLKDLDPGSPCSRKNFLHHRSLHRPWRPDCAHQSSLIRPHATWPTPPCGTLVPRNGQIQRTCLLPPPLSVSRQVTGMSLPNFSFPKMMFCGSPTMTGNAPAC